MELERSSSLRIYAWPCTSTFPRAKRGHWEERLRIVSDVCCDELRFALSGEMHECLCT